MIDFEKMINFEEACRVICRLCNGSGEEREESDPIPRRIDNDDYIPNFGDVKEGNWIHDGKWGDHFFCDAAKLREHLRIRELRE